MASLRKRPDVSFQLVQPAALSTNALPFLGYLLAFFLPVVFLLLPGAPAVAMDFADCEELRPPQSSEQAFLRCIYLQGARGTPEPSMAFLRHWLAEAPDSAWGLLNLAHLMRSPAPEEARLLYERAIDLFEQTDEMEGLLQARDAYSKFLWALGDLEEAGQQADAALATLDVKPLSDIQRARVWILWARYREATHTRLAEAYSRLLDARPLLFPEGPAILKAKYLFVLGRLASSLARHEESYRHYRQLAEMAKREGMTSWEFDGNSFALLQIDSLQETFQDSFQRDQVIELTRWVLERARAIEAQEWELLALVSLAELLQDDEQAIALTRQCIEKTTPEDNPFYWRYCRFSLAGFLASTDLEAARKLIDETLARTPVSDTLANYSHDLYAQLKVFWAAELYDDALEATWAILDHLEDLRDTQSDVAGRQGLFADWASTYPWVAGRMRVRYEETGQFDWLRHAFHVSERMRARTLLDILDTADVTDQENPRLLELRAARGRVLEKITQAQQRLRRPSLNRRQRQELLEDIEMLENRQRLLKAQIAHDNERFRNLEDPDFASLEEVQANLQPNQALLSFQAAPWEGLFEAFPGGSWVTVVTTDGVKLHRLPLEAGLSDRVAQLIQMLEEGQPEGPAAARLYELLLEDALAELPAAVDELLLVLDGPLHPLPFAALRPTPDSEPLALRFRITRIPSATLWLRWQESPLPPGPASALVLADPVVSEAAKDAPEATTRDGLARVGESPLRDGVLGPLPWARREGWNVRRFLGPGTLLLTGEEASEAFIKRSSLTDYRLLHLAAHAVVTEGDPEIFNVQLAPGSDAEDGFLQFREITELDLQGLTVVLSTCHSATGAVLRGEGVLDLARAFFQSGARAVVGSLWRLEDRATARFFADFHRHLARGMSVSQALHRSQVDQIRAGRPASEWAGIVLVGDGEVHPLPEPTDRIPSRGPLAAAALCLAAGAMLYGRRRGPRAAP